MWKSIATSLNIRHRQPIVLRGTLILLYILLFGGANALSCDWPLRARGLGRGTRRCLVGREHLPDSKTSDVL